jgi:hypothetical protein
MGGAFVIALAGEAPWDGLIVTGLVGLVILGTALVLLRLAIGMPPPEDDRVVATEWSGGGAVPPMLTMLVR